MVGFIGGSLENCDGLKIVQCGHWCVNAIDSQPAWLPFISKWMCTGTYLGETDDTTDEKVIQGIIQAVHGGINVIDTSINYRGQKAERCVGKSINLCIEVLAPCIPPTHVPLY